MKKRSCFFFFFVYCCVCFSCVQKHACTQLKLFSSLFEPFLEKTLFLPLFLRGKVL